MELAVNMLACQRVKAILTLCLLRVAAVVIATQNEAAVSGPGATTATRTKALGAPLSTLGLAFARLTEAQQQQHEAQLLALVGPHLGYLGDKALRKKLLQEPRDKLGAAQEGRERLLEALAGIKGTAAGGAGARLAGESSTIANLEFRAAHALA
jgi:hypothetical protein